MFLLLPGLLVPLALTDGTPAPRRPRKGRNAPAAQRRTRLESNVSPLEGQGKHVHNPILDRDQHRAVLAPDDCPVPAPLYDRLQVKPSPALLRQEKDGFTEP
jgi:hypothetical protein